MTRCPRGPKKRRISRANKGNPSNYKHSLRGHSWKKKEGIRICEKCGKIHKLKMISSYYEIREEKNKKRNGESEKNGECMKK